MVEMSVEGEDFVNNAACTVELSTLNVYIEGAVETKAPSVEDKRHGLSMHCMWELKTLT